MNPNPKLTTSDALTILANTKMEPFSGQDWMSFAGCDSDNPLIGTNDQFGRDLLLIVDGDVLQIFTNDGEPDDGQSFKLGEQT